MVQPRLLALLLLALAWVRVCTDDAAKVISDRYAVYWNRSNPRFHHGDYTVEVSINDYLDIYCPHYEKPLPPAVRMEQYVLYMVNDEGHASCDHRQKGFKRWECNRPMAPNGPLKFSEKFQLFTPFSLGFEFRPGHDYYYICGDERLRETQMSSLGLPPGFLPTLLTELEINNTSGSENALSTPADLKLLAPGTYPAAATPPNMVDRSCLKLKVYVKPTNDSLYESPEPIFTSNNSCSSLRMSQLFLSVVPVFWTIFTS